MTPDMPRARQANIAVIAIGKRSVMYKTSIMPMIMNTIVLFSKPNPPAGS
jgi:hypothetical protein